MKKLPVILSFLATSLMGSSFTNSMEEKPTGGVAIGMPSQKFSEFRADFEAMPQRDMSSSPLSHPSSVPSGRSEFYKEVFKVGTRHQHAAALSEQDEIERALKESRLEAEFAEQEREALEESVNLHLDILKEQEIAHLEEQMGMLEDLASSISRNRDTLYDSSIANISKIYGYNATDTDQTRAAAQRENDRIKQEISDSSAEVELIWREQAVLRDKLFELRYGRSLVIPVASSEHLPLGIRGPSGFVTNGLPTIHSSALPVVQTDTGVDKL